MMPGCKARMVFPFTNDGQLCRLSWSQACTRIACTASNLLPNLLIYNDKYSNPLKTKIMERKNLLQPRMISI